jgi:hypothetical protein
MTSPDDQPRAGTQNVVEDLRRFVEDMARFTTAADQLADEEFRIAFAEEHDLNPEKITEEDVLAELDEERLYGETMAFWEMIRRARQLLAGAKS